MALGPVDGSNRGRATTLLEWLRLEEQLCPRLDLDRPRASPFIAAVADFQDSPNFGALGNGPAQLVQSGGFPLYSGESI